MDDPLAPTSPIACDMSDAPDTPEERVAEYRRLFELGPVKERTEAGFRFRFADRPGLADWVGDLSEREHACCPFLYFEVARRGDELWWDVSTLDDDSARLVLDELCDLSGSARSVTTDRVAFTAIEWSGDR